MDNYSTAATAHIPIGLGGQHIKHDHGHQEHDVIADTGITANAGATAITGDGPESRRAPKSSMSDISESSPAQPVAIRRNRTASKERSPDIVPRAKAAEALIPHVDPRTQTDPEYLHLWAAIERHFAQISSKDAVLNEIIGCNPPFVLGITSAVVGEGKTTVSISLAESAARNTWYRVCLIDLGLDGDEISSRHGIESDGTGVVALLESQDGSQFTAHSLPTYRLDDRGGLSVLPAGKAPTNPARVARSPHLGSLIECLRHKFDLIIVDLPAVSTDNALPISAQMDGIVVVARAGATPADLIENAVDKVGRQNVIGVVLNRVNFSGPTWMKRILQQW